MRELDLTHVFDTEPPELDFIICRLVAGTVGNIGGPGGIGKSFAALEMGMGVASAEADSQLLSVAYGNEGSVAIFNLEDPDSVNKTRFKHIGHHLNLSARRQVLANLKFHSYDQEANDIMCPRFLGEVIKKCQNKRLVIFDTFSRFHNLTENDNGQMTQVIRCYEKIAFETGAAVLFIHHSSKAAVLSGQQVLQQANRGASAITDNCRWQGYIQSMSFEEERAYGLEEGSRNRFVKFGGNKENYGPPTAQRWLERVENGVFLPTTKFLNVTSRKSKPNLKIVEKVRGNSNDTFI